MEKYGDDEQEGGLARYVLADDDVFLFNGIGYDEPEGEDDDAAEEEGWPVFEIGDNEPEDEDDDDEQDGESGSHDSPVFEIGDNDQEGEVAKERVVVYGDRSDLIHPGKGQTIITGKGKDIVEVSVRAQEDGEHFSINDFEDGMDKLWIRGLGFEDLSFHEFEDEEDDVHTDVYFPGGGTVRLWHVSKDQIDPSDFRYDAPFDRDGEWVAEHYITAGVDHIYPVYWTGDQGVFPEHDVPVYNPKYIPDGDGSNYSYPDWCE